MAAAGLCLRLSVSSLLPRLCGGGGGGFVFCCCCEAGCCAGVGSGADVDAGASADVSARADTLVASRLWRLPMVWVHVA